MKTKIFRRTISLLLSLLITASVFAVSAVPADAADSNLVNITIEMVTRKYKEAASFLDLCNDFRANKDLPAWEMDSGLLELAMVKAAEISVYVDEKNLDGTSFLDNTDEKRGVIVGYDVTNNSSLITSFQDDSVYMSYFNSKTYKSAGVGVCTVMKKKYIVVLLSDKTPDPVDSAVLTQTISKFSQPTKCKSQYLKEIRMNFKDNDQIVCGGDAVMRLIVTNQFYPDAEAYISGTSTYITSSDVNVFKPNGDGTITGITPGVATIKMTLKDDSSLSASATIRAVAKTFAGCTIGSIPDQIYTGTAITPSVSIVSTESVSLVVGKDYTVSYSNNINVGVAVVKLTGIGAYSGASASVNFNIINDPSSFSVTVKSSVPAVEIGQAANIIATAANGTDPIKYKFEVAPQGSSSFSVIQAASTKASCVYTPTAAGVYTVRVTATDSANKIAMSNVQVEVSTPIDITIDLSASYVTLGNTVTINTKATGGSSPYKFAYYVLEPGKSSYTALASYGTLQTLTYTPSAVGTYQVRVDCKGSNDIIASKSSAFSVSSSAISNTSTVSASEVTAGTAVTLYGKASGGVSPYTYAYYYKKSSDSSWTSIGTVYGSSTSQKFTPTAAGTYNLKTIVKDNGGKTAEKTFSLTVKEKAADLANSSTVSPTTVTTNNSVTMTGKATGGTTPYKYAYYYKLSSASTWTTVGTEFGTATSATFKPTSAGTYNVKIIVKDNAGTTAEKTFTVTAKNALANSSTVSPTTVTTNNSVTMTGKATGGTTPYKYAYYYKLSSASTWTTVGTEFGTATSATFKPTSAGTYNVKIIVKDNAGTTAEKTYTVTAYTPLVNSSSISSTKQPAGIALTLTGKASGGKTPYKYAMYYKRTENSKWNVVGTEYGTATSGSFTPVSAGTFDIKINVKDGNGTVTQKTFTFTATAALANNSSINANKLPAGNKVIVTAAASGGTSPYTYAMYYKRTENSKWNVLGTEYGTATSGTFTPVSSGSFDIKVKVKDKNGTIAEKSFVFTAAEPLVNSSTVNTTKLVLGNKLTMTGAASGGTAPYKYAFLYKRSTSSSWVTIGTAYDGTTSAGFTPTALATYDVKVNVKDSTGGVTAKTFTVTTADLVNSSLINYSKVGVGTAVTLKGKASGGNSDYKYAFYFKRSTNTSWNTIGTAYDGTTSTTFTPTAQATYNFKISVKDAKGFVASKTFKMTATDLQNTSSLSYSKVGVGTTIDIKGAASGGKASYKYSYYFKRSTNTSWNLIGTEFTSESSVSFKPTAQASYNIRVIAKDANEAVAVKTLTLTATDLENKSVVNYSKVGIGTSVTISGKASGGKASYKYAFYFKRSANTSWNLIGTAYDGSTVASLTPTAAADYDIKVIAKDANSAVSVKTMKITATTLANKSTISASTVKAGTKVTISGKASGGKSPYTYAFYYKRSENTKWNVIGTEFSSTASASFTPTAAAGYTIRVIVKDADGTVAVIPLTLKST